jgi:hypothetical protein
MLNKKYPLGKNYKEVPHLSISLFTRYTTMESCFGDIEEEEENLAYSILKSLKKVRLLFSNKIYIVRN